MSGRMRIARRGLWWKNGERFRARVLFLGRPRVTGLSSGDPNDNSTLTSPCESDASRDDMNQLGIIRPDLLRRSLRDELASVEDDALNSSLNYTLYTLSLPVTLQG